MLLRMVRNEITALYHIQAETLLCTVMQAGMTGLKTPMCYAPETQHTNCPVCSSTHVSHMAAALPFSHHEASYMVCPLSGRIMNEDNYPMSLPNGHVYSYQAVQEHADQEHAFQCPKTSTRYTLSDMKRVFVL